jgi:hypothetical protein
MDYEFEQRLDSFVRGESVETAFIEELCAVCATKPDFTWDVLATTDQYYRRGKISAELNRRISYAIARPALTRQVAAGADATSIAPKAVIAPIAPKAVIAPIAPKAAIAPIAPIAPKAPIAPAAQVVAPEELQEMRYDLQALHRKLVRYRTRIAKVIAFSRRHRDALAEMGRELKSSRVHSLVPFVPGPNIAAVLAPPGRGPVWYCTKRDESRRRSTWVRRSQLVAAIAVFLSVTASSALREAPIARVAAPAAATPAKVASELVQYLSLDSERYVVRPGERQALIRVRRTGGLTGKVSFTWWTRPSGAKSGADYRGRLPTLEQLPEGEDALTLSIPIIANPLRKHTELFYVAIGHPRGGAVFGAIRTSVVIIMPMS